MSSLIQESRYIELINYYFSSLDDYRLAEWYQNLPVEEKAFIDGLDDAVDIGINRAMAQKGIRNDKYRV